MLPGQIPKIWEPLWDCAVGGSGENFEKLDKETTLDRLLVVIWMLGRIRKESETRYRQLEEGDAYRVVANSSVKLLVESRTHKQ